MLPPVSKIKIFSEKEAISVAQTAIDQKLADESIKDAKEATENMKWIPKY